MTCFSTSTRSTAIADPPARFAPRAYPDAAAARRTRREGAAVVRRGIGGRDGAGRDRTRTYGRQRAGIQRSAMSTVFTANSGDNHWYPWLAPTSTPAAACRDPRAARRGARRRRADAPSTVTTPDLGRDAALVREMSEQSGMTRERAPGMWRTAGRCPSRPSDTDEPSPIILKCPRSRSAGEATPALKAGVIKVANDRTLLEASRRCYRQTIRGAARAWTRIHRLTPISTVATGRSRGRPRSARSRSVGT